MFERMMDQMGNAHNCVATRLNDDDHKKFKKAIAKYFKENGIKDNDTKLSLIFDSLMKQLSVLPEQFLFVVVMQIIQKTFMNYSALRDAQFKVLKEKLSTNKEDEDEDE